MSTTPSSSLPPSVARVVRRLEADKTRAMAMADWIAANSPGANRERKGLEECGLNIELTVYGSGKFKLSGYFCQQQWLCPPIATLSTS